MLHEQFLMRITLIFITGVIYISSMYKMAIYKPTAGEHKRHIALTILGCLSLLFMLAIMISLFFTLTQIESPTEMMTFSYSPNEIIRPSHTPIIWGYATTEQTIVFNNIYSVFLTFALSIYCFMFKKSNSQWWKKILKFAYALLLYVFFTASSNFHYFDIYEWIAPIGFTILCTIIFYKSSKINTTKMDTVTIKKEEHKNQTEKLINTKEEKTDNLNECIENNNISATIEEIEKDELKELEELNTTIDKDLEETTEVYIKNETSLIENNAEGMTNNNSDAQFCKYCGKKIDSDAIFCQYCGKKLNQIIVKPTIKWKETIFTKIKSFKQAFCEFGYKCKRILKPVFIFIIIASFALAITSFILDCITCKYSGHIFNEYYIHPILIYSSALCSVLFIAFYYLIKRKTNKYRFFYYLFFLISFGLSIFSTCSSIIFMGDYKNNFNSTKKAYEENEKLKKVLENLKSDNKAIRENQLLEILPNLYTSFVNVYTEIHYSTYLFDTENILKNEVRNGNNPILQCYMGAYYMGKYYHDGKENKEEKERAFYWFMQSAEGGFSSAQVVVGRCYAECYSDFDGIKITNITCDLNKAIYWFQKAAEQNHKKALYYLGNYYKDINIKLAKEYWQKAADQGFEKAYIALEKIY